MLKKYIFAIAVLLFGIVSVAHASTLTSRQIGSVIQLLRAFGANESIIANVEISLIGSPSVSTAESRSARTPATARCEGVPIAISCGESGWKCMRSVEFADGETKKFCANNIMHNASLLKFSTYDITDANCGDLNMSVKHLASGDTLRSKSGVSFGDVSAFLTGRGTVKNGEYEITLTPGSMGWNGGWAGSPLVRCNKFDISWRGQGGSATLTTQPQSAGDIIPPTINFILPKLLNGATTTQRSSLPYIVADIRDTRGSGVATSSVIWKNISNNNATGILYPGYGWVSRPVPLAIGLNTIEVSARDIAGNIGTAMFYATRVTP